MRFNQKCKMLGPLEYKVMTVLKRMFDKNIVTREHHSRSYFYFPTTPKEIFVNKCLDNLFRYLFKCYGDQVIKKFQVTAKKAKHECQNI